MKNLLNSVRIKRPGKNLFDLTHDVKLSMRMGTLVPTMIRDVIPGDKWQLSGDAMVRFAPLLAPVMQRFNCTMHYFFVPKRILWDGWEKWIMGDPAAPAHPYITVSESNHSIGDLLDYMGIPIPITGGANEIIDALPLYAYQFIFKEYYRDQNLQTGGTYELPKAINGDNTAVGNLLDLRRRAWEHDYFTSNLPFAQKGAAVSIPIGGDVVVKDPAIGFQGTHRSTSANAPLPGDVTNELTGEEVGGVPSYYDPQGSLEVAGTNVTINELRTSFRLQEWLEKAARAGTRYKEGLLSFFGVNSDDARLQRPEYITGTRTPVMISEVLNTAGIPDANPQGAMAGHGVGVTTGKYGTYYAKEHGFIMCIMNVQPTTTYQQGIDRMWTKIADRFQHFWPEFAHLGEQETLKREVVAFKSDGHETFGYLPRYTEYKVATSRVCGQFRDQLDYWHDGRIFDTSFPIELNSDFIECIPDNRIFAVENSETLDHLFCHVLHKVKAVRSMPKFGTPTF